MDRLILALICFWRILLSVPLPIDRLRAFGVLDELPPPLPAVPLPRIGTPSAASAAQGHAAPPRVAPTHAAPAPAPVAPPAALAPPAAPPAAAPPAPAPPSAVVAAPPARDLEAEQRARDEGALLMLATLQRDGRLLDFLMEKIDGYSDDQVGGAARAIHSGSKKAIAEHFTLEPAIREGEGASFAVERNTDTSVVRVTGNVRQPPFQATVKHHGWRARTIKPVTAPAGTNASVVMPAEVEA